MSKPLKSPNAVDDAAHERHTFGKLQVHLTYMPEDRIEQLETAAQESSEASEIIYRQPVSAFQHSPSSPLLCLIYDDKGRIRKGVSPAHCVLTLDRPCWLNPLFCMVRKLRVRYPGAVYHVMNRGDRREPIFYDDKDRELFLDTLGQVCAKTDWRVYASPFLNVSPRR